MPVKPNRDYRTFETRAMTAVDTKSDEPSYIVEGYALRHEPYVLYEHDGVAIYEVIERGALRDADLSDVIMQYDHTGDVFARVSNNTLTLEQRDDGLYIRAYLSSTRRSRDMYEQIASGLVNKMSWGFAVGDDYYDSESRTRHVRKIKKVYDVSAVSIPANDDTVIQARSFFDGVIEEERRESSRRKQQELRMRLKLQNLDLKEETQP